MAVVEGWCSVEGLVSAQPQYCLDGVIGYRIELDANRIKVELDACSEVVPATTSIGDYFDNRSVEQGLTTKASE